MKKVILLGFMGSGKSTLGRRIHAATGIQFVDLDTWIEEWQGRSIREIFAKEGEMAFREMEHQALHQLQSQLSGDWLLACGGGTPCFGGNMDLLNSIGTTIYLKVSPKELARRIFPGKEHRPLIANYEQDELEEFIRDLLGKREAYYERAHLILNENEVGSWFKEFLEK
ncbi:MAG: shikimate kinase [Bacteroidia bacterium]|nr:shikimate kinase [Bacteroidia bacterium]